MGVLNGKPSKQNLPQFFVLLPDNLLKLRVSSLKQKIQDQEKTIQYLTQKADSAICQVQDIACKAIDSTSDRVKSFPSHLHTRLRVRKRRKAPEGIFAKVFCRFESI